LSILAITPQEIQARLKQIEPYLKRQLLPFWLDNGSDEKFGGFLTHFDREGQPSGGTDKTLVGQTRLIYTMASAHRSGYGDLLTAFSATEGVEFLIDNYWDDEYGGWYWNCDRQGWSTDESKIVYGQSFAIYALSEFTLATGKEIGQEYAERTFDLLVRNAAETEYGGYYEMLNSDWSPKSSGAGGGDRKTFDVHMHLMEAFTALYELTGSKDHERKLRAVVGILLNRMLEPTHGTGVAQFALDWTPLRAIQFKNIWGNDREADDFEGRPLNNTSYGHNVEFAWLLQHTLDVLGDDIDDYKDILGKLYDHAVTYGVDREHGGIFVEGPHDGEATQTLKEFWQQAEAMVGFLDAYLLYNSKNYWDAFTSVFEFTWEKMINHDVGEWFALLERDGTVKWDYLGHEWKTSYHTVRSMIQCVDRLKQLERLT